ncbi:MAG: hypothetical protein IIY77_00375 [Lachnospiraceae bacterium]|nr:hypothetical protein [Lachnospiraceae bacterium]
MKKIRWIIAVMLLAFMAFGNSCGSGSESGDKLFEKVSLSGNFTISRYQNDHYERLFIGGSSKEETEKMKQEILSALKKASYRKSELAEEAKEPFYAIDLYEAPEEGLFRELFVSFADGKLIFPDGTAYQTNLDFEKLIETGGYELYSWEQEKRESTAAYNSFYWLLKGKDGFRRELLRTGPRFGEKTVTTPEGTRLIPEGISEEGVLQASLVNDSGQEQSFKDSDYNYRVDVLLDGKWCRVPTLPDKRYTLDSLIIGKKLAPGDAFPRYYPIQEVYGKLPAGRYRAVEYQTERAVEFDSTEEGKLSLPAMPLSSFGILDELDIVKSDFDVSLYDGKEIRTYSIPAGMYKERPGLLNELAEYLKELPAVPEKKLPDTLSFPLVNMTLVSGKEPENMFLLGEEGYLMFRKMSQNPYRFQDTVYRCSIDWTAFLETFGYTLKQTVTPEDQGWAANLMTRFYPFISAGEKWQTALLTEDEEAEDRLKDSRSTDTGLSLKVYVSADHPGKLIGRIENHSEKAWSYNKNYAFPMLSLKLEDKWYQLPRYPWGAVLIDDYAEIASLAPGEYLYRIYDIEWAYRKLLPGHYMIWENNGPCVEFDVTDENGKTVIVP